MAQQQNSAFKNPFDVLETGDGSCERYFAQVPASVEQAFKRIAKKDAVTRLKGFGELLVELRALPRADAQALGHVLRARLVALYEKHFLGHEKQVRLCLVQVMQVFLVDAAAARSFLGPVLRDFLPLWMMGTFDTFSEAAQLQRTLFNDLFPPTKHAEICARFGPQLVETVRAHCSSGGQRLKLLEDVVRSDFGGSDADVLVSVELAKVEALGLLSFFIAKSAEPDAPALLSDAAFLAAAVESAGVPRRVALYRLFLVCAERGLESPLRAPIGTLVLAESYHSALGGAFDCALCLVKTSAEFKVALSKQIASDSHLCQLLASISDSKCFGKLFSLVSELGNVDTGDLLDRLYQMSTGSMALKFQKEALQNVWLHLAQLLVASVTQPAQQDDLLRRFIFPNATLPLFPSMSQSDTVKCLVRAFGESVIGRYLQAQSGSDWRCVYVALYMADEAILREQVLRADADAVLRPELKSRIPPALLAERLRLELDAVPFSRAYWGQVDRGIVMALLLGCEPAITLDKQLLLFGLLPLRDQVVVLERSAGLQVHLRSLPVEAKLAFVPVALSCMVGIFGAAEVEQIPRDLLCTALASGDATAGSPLIGMLSKCAWMKDCVARLEPELTPDALAVLLQNLDVSDDLDCYLRYKFDPNVQYPIKGLERLSAAFLRQHPWSMVTVLLPHAPVPLDHQKSLVRLFDEPLPLDNAAFLREVVLIAYIFKITISVPFPILEALFDAEEESWHLWAVFRLLIRADNPMKRAAPAAPSNLKESLRCYLQFRADSGYAETVSDWLFSEAVARDAFPWIMLVFSIEPVLALRTDCLSVLVSGAVLEGDAVVVFCTRQCQQSGKQKREFWNCLWRDRMRGVLQSRLGDNLEVCAQFACALWDVLEAPEQELLAMFAGQLSLEGLGQGTPSTCQLYVLALPFLGETPTLETISGILCESTNVPVLLAARSVFVTHLLDAQLVRAQQFVEGDDGGQPDALDWDRIFPLWGAWMARGACQLRDIFIYELLLCCMEGSREEGRLLAAYEALVRTRLLDRFRTWVRGFEGCALEMAALEGISYVPNAAFDLDLMVQHVIYRSFALFPVLLAGTLEGESALERGLLGALRAREFQRLRRGQHVVSADGKLEIVLRPVLTSTTSHVQVGVTYAEEIKLGLVLQLPARFPLAPVSVEGQGCAGLSEGKWRATQLSLQAQLRATTFDGNVVQAVRRWQGNALRLFEGLEACAVCYCVVHPSDRSLPRPACRTCQHRFHASCLYKWFRSSGNATCPLCRALF